MTACSDSGPIEGFDITGKWKEIKNRGTLEFKEDGKYEITFPKNESPTLGIIELSGSYKRIDNSRVQLSTFWPKGDDFEFVDLVGRINSENILNITIKRKTYKYAKD